MGIKSHYAGHKDKVPGPGQYQQDSNAVYKSIGYSFGIKTGSALGVEKNALNPGPG